MRDTGRQCDAFFSRVWEVQERTPRTPTPSCAASPPPAAMSAARASVDRMTALVAEKASAILRGRTEAAPGSVGKEPPGRASVEHMTALVAEKASAILRVRTAAAPGSVG